MCFIVKAHIRAIFSIDIDPRGWQLVSRSSRYEKK